MHVDSPDDFVGVRDLENFLDKLEEVDSGPPWDQLMHKKTDSMEYRAWKRDTEVLRLKKALKCPIHDV